MWVTPPLLGPTDLPQYTTWYVIDDLRGLRGPGAGWLELPNHLWWNGHPRFSLDDPDQVRAAYRAVLREAVCEEDLTLHINRDLLVENWPYLLLPKPLQRLWAEAHPELSRVRDVYLVTA
jgi:hypothetical protein